MTNKKTVQTRYKEGDEYHQILLNRVKKDRLYKSGKPNLSEANRRIVRDHPRLEQENKRLTDTVDLLRSSGMENTLLSFPSCPDSHTLPNDPSKRRCSRKKNDRWVDLPKLKGMFIVDDAGLCELCQAREKRWVELNIMGDKKKVTRKDVFLAEAKKRYYQDDEQKAKEQNNKFTEQDGQIRKIRESMKPHLQSIRETDANQKKKKKRRDGRKSYDKRDRPYGGRTKVVFPHETFFDDY